MTSFPSPAFAESGFKNPGLDMLTQAVKNSKAIESKHTKLIKPHLSKMSIKTTSLNLLKSLHYVAHVGKGEKDRHERQVQSHSFYVENALPGVEDFHVPKGVFTCN